MACKKFRVFGAEGHRQRESFQKSCLWDWSNGENTRIVAVLNSDATGTNEYSDVVIVRDTEEECYAEIRGQVSDGVFENSVVGYIEEVAIGSGSLNIQITCETGRYGSNQNISIPIEQMGKADEIWESAAWQWYEDYGDEADDMRSPYDGGAVYIDTVSVNVPDAIERFGYPIWARDADIRAAFAECLLQLERAEKGVAAEECERR